MDAFALCLFLACALGVGGTLCGIGNWLEDRRLRREYAQARKEFHDAIARGEKRELAPVYIKRLGNVSVEFRDIVQTERFKRQMSVLKEIRARAVKQNLR